MRKPFFRKFTQTWYVRHNGKQVRLGKDKTEAFQAYHRLMAESADAPPLDKDTEAAEVLGMFMVWAQTHRDESTFRWYQHFLTSFGEFIGSRKVSDLKPHHVTKWLEKHKYTGNTANAAVRAVLRAFNWAVKSGHLEKNPIAGVEKPAATPRECYIEPEQWTKLLGLVKGPFRDFLTILRETGCRPQEAKMVEARHFDRQMNAWVFPRKESKGKKRQRVVPLNGAALALTQRLVAKHPTGPLFLNSKGEPWTNNALRCRFRSLSRKMKLELCCYAIRHSFITDALLRGVEPMTLATIVGHVNIDMIWTTYQKIRVKQDHIRAAVKQATGEVA